MRPRDWPKAARCQVATVFFALSAIAVPQPGSIDPTFSAGRGPIQVFPGTGYGTVLQSDGKVVVGGSFNGIGLAPSDSVVRFNSDGSLDPAFDSSSIEIDEIANGFYTKPLCLQADGKIIIGGSFSTSDGAHHSLLRLNTNGALDTAFNPVIQSADQSFPPIVNVAIVQADGKLLISGLFATVNGVARPSLARLNLDGTLDTTLAPASGGGAIALQQDGKILTTSGGLQPSVVRLNSDGSIDSSFHSDLTNVRSLFLQSDGKVIVSEDVFFGEQFATVRLNSDGATDQSFIQQSGLAIGLDANDRAFLTVTGTYPGFERLNTDGTIDSTFQPGADVACCAGSVVEQPDQKLIVAGGSFSVEPFGLRRLLDDGQTDPTFNLGLGLTTSYPGDIGLAQLLPDGRIIVSGIFNYMDTLPRTQLARLNHDGTPDPVFDAGITLSAPVGVLAAQPDGRILIRTDDFPNDIIRLETTGAVDPTFQYTPPTFTSMTAMALQSDAKILVGHEDAFLRLNPDGTPDFSFDPGLDAGRGVTQILLQPDGKILINGNFSSIHGAPRNGPTRLNSDGSLDENFGGVNAFISSLAALQPNGKPLVTYYQPFTTYLERLNADGTVDGTFNILEVVPGPVVATQDSIYLGPNDVGSNTIRRLQTDGTVDSNFAPLFPPDSTLSQLLVQVDGQIIATGGFAQVNGAVVNGIVRLNGVAPEKVANISTRATVGTLDAVEIGGFIITGTAEKSVVIRAIGPSLQVAGSPLAGTLSNPRLELRDSTGQLIAENDNWRGAQEADIVASGLAPLDDRESAIAATLTPGAYTAVAVGVDDETGIALVEVYDNSPASDSRLQNISTRGSVQSGDDVLIAGLILSGPESAPIVARAIGPSLAAFDVADPLSDPTIEVHDQSGAIIASNDDWKETQEAELIAVGLAPTHDKEAALLATLPPGPYTAIVRGANGATGVGLVEFYDTR